MGMRMAESDTEEEENMASEIDTENSGGGNME